MAHVSSTTNKHNKMVVGFGICSHVQIAFNLTRDDYVALYKPRKDKLVASDLQNTLLQDMCAAIETVEGLPVIYHGPQCVPSRSRGRPEEVELYPDKPRQLSVCGEGFMLNPSHHNKLCLLRGLLRELIPEGTTLGKPLCSTVRLALVLCFVLFVLVALFSAQDGLANRVLRSLEETTSDSDNEVSSTNV